jgi:AmpD protein
MEIENHIFKESKYFKSPNFNDRPNSSDIRLLVIHSISLPPNNYGGDYVKDFFFK